MSVMPDKLNLADQSSRANQQITKTSSIFTLPEGYGVDVPVNSVKKFDFFLPTTNDSSWYKRFRLNTFANDGDYAVAFSQKQGTTLPPLATMFAPTFTM